MEEGNKTEQIKQMLEERSEKDSTKPVSLGAELDEAKKYYSEKGSTVKVKSVFAKDGFFYPDDDEIYKLKHDFIVDLVGLANEKNDAEFETYLKDVAKKFDEKLNGNINDSLFLGLVSAYPELLSKSDLKWMVDNVKGKKEKFVSLCDFILCYINPEKEPNACDKDSLTDEEILKRFNFIWEIFKAIKSYGEGWAKIGETYLDSLFGDDYVSFGIFTNRLFKKRRAKNFISEVNKYAAKYLKGSRFDLHSTEIYDHYRQVKKSEKKRNVIVIIASVAVVAALGAGTIAFVKSTDNSTIEFRGDKSVVIAYTYGSEPDLGGWYITYKTRDGAEHTEKVTLKMLSGVDKSKIGEQQSVTLTYGGKTVQIQIRIDPAVLAIPSITRVGTDVTWESIPNATGYEIYVTDTTLTRPNAAPSATVGESATSFNLASVCKSGKSRVFVRAIFTDDDDLHKDPYTNSEYSAFVEVEKLGKVNAASYSGGTLGWSAVDKADKYDVAVNGTVVADGIPATSYSYSLDGGDEVTITAKSNDETIYSSAVSFTVLGAPTVTYEGDYVSYSGGALYNAIITDATGKVVNRLSNASDDKINVSGFAKGVYTVSVQAAGSGDNVSSPERVTKFAIGHFVTVDKTGGTQKITWDGNGLGSDYKLSINGGEQINLAATEFRADSDEFRDAGSYTVTVVATENNVILRSVTLTKLNAPELKFDKVSGTWSAVRVEAGQTAVYTADGTDCTTLPTAFETGKAHTVTAFIKTENATEINSETTTVTVYKLDKPTIRVVYGGEERMSYDNEEEGVNLDCYYVSGGKERNLNFDDLTAGDSYSVYGRTVAQSYKNYTYVLDSDNSEPITVIKHAKISARDLVHNDDDTLTVGGVSSGITFLYRQKGSGSEYTALPANSVASLPAGSYDVCAVRNGSLDGGVYYVRSDRSDPIEVNKANILFTIEYYGGNEAIVAFGDSSDKYDFTYIVTYWVGEDKTTSTEKPMQWAQLRDGKFRIRLGSGEITGVTEIAVTIKMNGVQATNFWGTTK